jgi:CRP-like cAMP-binding protein
MTEGFRRNAILAQLPDGEYATIRPHLRLEQSAIRRMVYQPGQPISEVFFPLSSVFSLVAVSGERIVIEVATVGHEGMVGLPVFLGAASSPQAAFCQVAGETARLSVEDLHLALNRDGVLHALLNRFTHATMVQVAQNVVCNRSHSTEARAARWLLTTRDQVDRDQFPLTQEFIAQMLGVHRPTVSDVAQRIQAQGTIRYSRGLITITNRSQLERTACDCYWIVKAELDAIRNQRPKSH